MKRFLVDTNILIDLLRNDSKAAEFIETNASLITISYITYFELLTGARNKREFQMILEFLEVFHIDFGNEEIHKISMELIKKHFLKDKVLLNDAVIAATALTKKYTLITNDLKHMGKIEGLKMNEITF